MSAYKPQQPYTTKATSSFLTNANKPPLLPLSSNTIRSTQRPYPHVSADVKAEKIVKGLCYFCDKKYDTNHKCNFKQTQIFTVEVTGSEMVENDHMEPSKIDDLEKEMPDEVEP